MESWLACRILFTGLIARLANDWRDPLRFLTDFRDEIGAAVEASTSQATNAESRAAGRAQTVDELFSLMKPQS
jgi:hypothetical protein